MNVRREGAKENDSVYYLLHETSAIEALVIEETDFSEGRGYEAFVKSSYLNDLGQIVLDQSKIFGRHFWRGSLELTLPRYGLPNSQVYTYFCSDEFRRRMRALKNARFTFKECVVT